MRKQVLLLSTIGVMIWGTSCVSNQELIIHKNMLPIEFEPLSAKDFSIQKNLSAEVTLTGAYKKGKKVYHLDKKDNVMHIGSIIPDQINLIGNLHNENVVNVPLYQEIPTIVGSTGLSSLLSSLGVEKENITPRILGNHFAFVSLVEKYPDIDYFTNVRFDKKLIVTGSEFTETVKIVADGIELRTDN